MNAKKILLSLTPWLVFSLLAERHGSHAAALAALVSAIVAAAIMFRNRGTAGFKIIDVAGVISFTVLAVVAFVSSDSVDRHIADYGRGGTTLLLGLVMLGSVLAIPFTEQYARELVPQQYWGSPVFRGINRRLSVAWAMVALVAGIGHSYAGYRLSQGDLPIGLRLGLNWGVPLVLGLCALAYTKRLSSDDAAPVDAPSAA
jgi:hypothetical protein